MDFKVAKINGQDIMRDSSAGILYTKKEWRRLSVSQESKNISGYHGRIVSPTYARTRIITLEGVIDRESSDQGLGNVSYLQNLFVLQESFLKTNRIELYIQDMYDQEWKMYVKVTDPLEILEGDDDFRGSHWRWRVVLESLDSPIYTSVETIEVLGLESQYGGFTFPFTFPLAWDALGLFIECTTSGNIASPARIEIIANGDINSHLKIQNITTGESFTIIGDMEPGDKVIVDSKERTLTKNDVNALGNRAVGSIWPSIKGTTIFSIEDIDGGFEESDFSVKIIFNNSLL